MKYIRTANGIYDIETAPIVYVDDVKCVEFLAGKFTSRYEKIIQESDTIEELCDEFVYYHHLLTTEEKQNKDYLNTLYMFNDVYGAIWTDKGLIYVAKMNEKGELELI